MPVYRRPMPRPVAPVVAEVDPQELSETQRKMRLNSSIMRQKLGRTWSQIVVPSFNAGSSEEL